MSPLRPPPSPLSSRLAHQPQPFLQLVHSSNLDILVLGGYVFFFGFWVFRFVVLLFYGEDFDCFIGGVRLIEVAVIDVVAYAKTSVAHPKTPFTKNASQSSNEHYISKKQKQQ